MGWTETITNRALGEKAVTSRGPVPSLLQVGALAGVAEWPMNQRVAGSIPSQGTCLGCGPGSLEGSM